MSNNGANTAKYIDYEKFPNAHIRLQFLYVVGGEKTTLTRALGDTLVPPIVVHKDVNLVVDLEAQISWQLRLEIVQRKASKERLHPTKSCRCVIRERTAQKQSKNRKTLKAM